MQIKYIILLFSAFNALIIFLNLKINKKNLSPNLKLFLIILLVISSTLGRQIYMYYSNIGFFQSIFAPLISILLMFYVFMKFYLIDANKW
jgi:hypothetical protein